MNLPPIARVFQSNPQPRVSDIPGTVEKIIRESGISKRIKPGGTVAVGVGSRGIAVISIVAKKTVEVLKELGYKPFIVAAMGSHGGASSEGQRELLAGYGVTEESMGVEVRTDMETLVLGTSPAGLPIYFDRNAYSADGIVLINRIKPHTEFNAKYESGILKMLVIGLGKREGASQVHKLGTRGLKEVLPEVGKFLLKNTKFALGVAIVENADDVPADIVALEPDTILDLEPKLLDHARKLIGQLPFDQIDILIVGELGKNYSGAGMDPNVIGRRMVETEADFERPVITRMAVLDASEETHGNIIGVGLADLTTERLVAKMDRQSSYINALTCVCLERTRIPITLTTDRDVFQTALETCWRIDANEVRLVIIPNTLEVKTLFVSPALEEEVNKNDQLKLQSEFKPIPFLTDGSLNQEALFPDSVRGRRAAGAYVAH